MTGNESYPYRVFLKGINYFILVHVKFDHIQKFWDYIQENANSEDDTIILPSFNDRRGVVNHAIMRASEIVAIDDDLELSPIDIDFVLKNRKNLSDNKSKQAVKDLNEIGQTVSKRARNRRNR